MIRVLVEIWPGGSEAKRRTLGEAFIANVGGTPEVGNYEARLMKSPEYASSPGVWKRGRVDGFPRLRLGPWDLLYRVLMVTVGNRSRKDVPAGESRE